MFNLTLFYLPPSQSANILSNCLEICHLLLFLFSYLCLIITLSQPEDGVMLALW